MLVRVLLDEQLPRQLAQHLVGHEVRTVQQQAWAGNALEDLTPLVPEALTAISRIQAGQVLRVPASSSGP